MQRIIITFLACFFLANVLGQTKSRIMLFVEPEYSYTLNDRTKGNNSEAFGLGIQAVLVNKTMFSPFLNITDDFVFIGDRVLRHNPDGSKMDVLENVLKIFAGINVNPTERFYFAMAAGPAFINGETLLGIKPSIGFYFPKTKRWTAKISYTNIYNRDSGEKENYTSLNFSVGLRIL